MSLLSTVESHIDFTVIDHWLICWLMAIDKQNPANILMVFAGLICYVFQYSGFHRNLFSLDTSGNVTCDEVDSHLHC